MKLILLLLLPLLTFSQKKMVKIELLITKILK